MARRRQVKFCGKGHSYATKRCGHCVRDVRREVLSIFQGDGVYRPDQPTLDRFYRLVDLPHDPEGCWLWCGTIKKNHGYGQFTIRGICVLAHRWSYLAHHGRLDPKLTLDHTCKNRHCVNPAHLEECTMQVNNARSESPSAKNAAKTHCNYGHEFAGENLGINKNGSRYCRTCKRSLRDANIKAYHEITRR